MTHEEIRDVATACASHTFGIDEELIRGRTRPDAVAKARHCVAAVMRLYHGMSSSLVGRLTGRDHGTILNSVQQHIAMMQTSSDYRMRARVVIEEVGHRVRESVESIHRNDTAASAVILGEVKR